jgi:aspartate ammonia-lyase
MAMAHDQALSLAAAMGSLELNPFMPLVAHSLLESLDLLARACDILRRHCVLGLQADEARCRAQVENGTAAATALLPLIGYERAAALAAQCRATGQGLKAAAVASGLVSAEQFDQLTSPEAVGRLGWRTPPA